MACHPTGVTEEDPGWTQIARCTVPGAQGHFWEQGPLWRASQGATLLSLGGSGPLRHRRQVLAIHDANIWQVPQAYDWRYRALHKFLRPRLARRAARLITVSRFSATELAPVLGVAPNRFEIVPNSAEHILRVRPDGNALARFGLEPHRYLLAVGSQSANKNIAALIAAHAQAGPTLPPLVLAGASLTCLTEQTTGIRSLGRVSDGALRSLYQGAAGFVFPSLYEGFGIPPLEAMALGTPVLAAQSSAMPDVLGQAPVWCEPTSVASIADGLRTLTRLTPTERVRKQRQGRAQADRFTWEHSAKRLAQILCDVSDTPRAKDAA